MRSRIIGTGSYAPAKVVTNHDLAEKVDTSDTWIRTRTGIRQRHIAAEDEQTSDMAVAAARRALEMAGKSPTDLDLLIVGTISADMPMPSCAAIVQAKLGTKAAAFDVSAACAGALYGLSIADKFIRCGDAKCVMVIGVELLSRLLNWEDRNTCVLFGDGAGAMLLAPSEDDSRGVLSTHLHTDGSFANILSIPGGGTQTPMTHDAVDRKLNKVQMQGREVFKVAVRSLTQAMSEALEANQVTPTDITHVVPHQANVRIIDAVLDKLRIDKERAVLNIDRYGNTSSASVPITLDEAVRGRSDPAR